MNSKLANNPRILNLSRQVFEIIHWLSFFFFLFDNKPTLTIATNFNGLQQRRLMCRQVAVVINISKPSNVFSAYECQMML